MAETDSPTNTEQVEAVDYRAVAASVLDSIGGTRGNGPEELAPIAQAAATLALVDEVAKLREALSPREDGWTGPDIAPGADHA